MKVGKFILLTAACAMFAAACWADGTDDPKVTIGDPMEGTALTPTSPNASFSGTATAGQCPSKADGPDCFVADYENELGHTITTLTIFVAANGNLTFSCSAGPFFATCTTESVSGGTDIIFSGGSGIPDLGPGCEGFFELDIFNYPYSTTVSGEVITTPEPGSGLMVLFGMLIFGLVSVFRRDTAVTIAPESDCRA